MHPKCKKDLFLAIKWIAQIFTHGIPFNSS
jgi:hypothetical protein